MSESNDARPRTPRRLWVFLIAVLLYVGAFALPTPGHEWFGGYHTFVLGAVGFFLTLASVPAQLSHGGFSSGDSEWLMLVACWCANPVFWIALCKAGRARWRGATCWSAVAAALASIYVWLTLDHPEHRSQLLSPAYAAWSGAMVLLFAACTWTWWVQSQR